MLVVNLQRLSLVEFQQKWMLVLHMTIVRKVCLDAELNGQNYVNLDIENANAYPPCLVDMDIEKGNSETPKTNDEDVEKLKIEGPLTKALQRQFSLQIREKVVQLVMNDSVVSPKFPSRGFRKCPMSVVLVFDTTR